MVAGFEAIQVYECLGEAVEACQIAIGIAVFDIDEAAILLA